MQKNIVLYFGSLSTIEQIYKTILGVAFASLFFSLHNIDYYVYLFQSIFDFIDFWTSVATRKRKVGATIFLSAGKKSDIFLSVHGSIFIPKSLHVNSFAGLEK